jgi:PleD family two-component response regulator
VSSVLERADAALLNAKENGRNRWVSSDAVV